MRCAPAAQTEGFEAASKQLRGRLGYYAPRLRSGRCPYCPQFDQRESPTLRRVLDELRHRVPGDFWLEFDASIKADAWLSRAEVDVMGSALFWARLKRCLAVAAAGLDDAGRALIKSFWTKFEEPNGTHAIVESFGSS